MNNFDEKFIAEMLSHGISPEEAMHAAEALSGIWQDGHTITNEDAGDVKRIADSVSAIILRRNLNYSAYPCDFPETVAPADNSKTYSEAPNSPFFQRLSKMRKGKQAFVSYFISSALRMASFITVVFSAVLVTAAIVAMVAITIAGILLFITGLIYGVSQMHTFLGSGLYEIGFGLILGSLASAFVILLYNAVTRAIPFCTSQLLHLISAKISDFRRFRKASAGNGGKK